MPTTTPTDNAGTVIDDFTGLHEFLSLSSDHPVEYSGRQWPTAAHAFAAAKTNSTEMHARIHAATTAAEAQRIGENAVRRDDWPTHRFAAITEIVASKFDDLALAAALLDTGDALLVNVGTDQLWGRTTERGFRTPTGRNELGRSLMTARARLRGDAPNRWVRAAVTGHREHRIPDPDTQRWVQEELGRLAHKLAAGHGTEIALCGLATGSDTWWAQASLGAGLHLWGYRPFPAQADQWTAEQIGEHKRLLAAAQRTVTLGGRADNKFFHARNALMLNDADVVIAVRDRQVTSGGTVEALRALDGRRPVITVDITTRQTTLAL